MKKLYEEPTLEVIVFDLQNSLMAPSATNTEETVNNGGESAGDIEEW